MKKPEISLPVTALISGVFLNVLSFSCVNPGAAVIRENRPVPVYEEDTRKPVFSVTHGIYESAFSVSVSSDTPGAFISYTLDCSDPLEATGAITLPSPAVIRIDPYRNPNGTLPAVILRASACAEGYNPSESVTHSYLFLNDIASLSPNEKQPGKLWPEQNKYSKVYQQFDYGLDPEIYTQQEYKEDLFPAFRQIPILSLVSGHENFFDRKTGIYTNPEYHGREWERAGSLELIDEEVGFQINAGIRIRGGWSRHKDFLKHSFRLFFRKEYGKGKLDYPLFGDEGVESFDKIDLRTSQNYSWANKYDTAFYNTMLRDIFSRDLQGDMGQPYTRSEYYHLFLNGCYWGLYQTQERPDARYAAAYFGGSVDDYDVIKVDVGERWNMYKTEATDGTTEAWRSVYDLARAGFASDEAYFRLEGRNGEGKRESDKAVLVDIDNLIDFMIIVFYTGNFDCPLCKFRGDRDPNNFYAIYNRTDNDRGFFFLVHDAEHCLFVDPVAVGTGLYENRVDLIRSFPRFEKFTPQDLHNALVKSPRYRKRFDERVKKHFSGDGALTYENNLARFKKRMNRIDLAIIAESARWGDGKRNKPMTKENWVWAVKQILEEFFPKRTAIVLEQLEAAGLYVP